MGALVPRVPCIQRPKQEAVTTENGAVGAEGNPGVRPNPRRCAVRSSPHHPMPDARMKETPEPAGSYLCTSGPA